MTRVFLLAGQSNMEGAGAVSSRLPASIRDRLPRDVQLFEDDDWRTLLWQDHFGPEVGFVRELAPVPAGDRLVLCKVARGGSNLHYDWHPERATGGMGERYLGPLYPKLIAAYTSVAAPLERSDERWECAGLLWMQGERDAVFETMARAYAVNLETLIAAVRADTGRERLPVVVGLVSPRVYELAHERFQHRYRQVVRDCQRWVARTDPRVALVDTTDLPQCDNLHYDTPGQFEFGRRCARAWLSVAGADAAEAFGNRGACRRMGEEVL